MKYSSPLSPTDAVLALAREQGTVRVRDLTSREIPHSYLIQLLESGQLQRLGRGLYALPDLEASEHLSLAQACARVPDGVACLLSALRFHEVGTQNPAEVWLAIEPKARLPRLDYPPLRIVRFSGAARSEGVEERRLPEGIVRVYGVAKTVADCFKYRNKIGLDVALEALRETVRGRRATIDDLWRFAKIDRVANVMRPYLESLM